MQREIKIFKTFEEQEKYKLAAMRNTSIMERFHILYQMQQMTRKLHPEVSGKRRIIISKNGINK